MLYMSHNRHDPRRASRAASALALMLTATAAACADRPQPFEPPAAGDAVDAGAASASAHGESPFNGIALATIDSRGRAGLLQFDIRHFTAGADAVGGLLARGVARLVDNPDLAEPLAVAFQVRLEVLAASATRCDDSMRVALHVAADNADLRRAVDHSDLRGVDNPDLIPALRLRTTQVVLTNDAGHEVNPMICDVARAIAAGASADALASALNDLMRSHAGADGGRGSAQQVVMLEDAQQRILPALPAGPERELADSMLRRLATELGSNDASRRGRGLARAFAELDELTQRWASASADLDALRLTLDAIAAALSADTQ